MSGVGDNRIGDPGYPAPWTTNRPLEGLRDVDDARIVSLSPDVCLTPVGSSIVPIPYPVVDYCGHDRNYTSSVRFTGYRAMVMRSCTTHVHGDAPGTKKGVKSGTVESICEPIGHASQVKAEGSHVIRHLDRFWMNNKNTQGEAIFVKNTKTFDPPKDDDPIPGSLRAATSTASRSEQNAAPPGAVLGFVAPAGGAALLGEGAAAGTAATGGAATTAAGGTAATATGVGLGTVLLGIGIFAAGMLIPTNKRNFSDFPPQDDYEAKRLREALQRIDGLPFWDSGGAIVEETKAELRKRRQTLATLQPVPLADTVRIKERDEYRKKCQVDRYGKMRDICGQYGMQAHHIVPDWTLRYGARSDGDKRIPNMPSLNDGMAICVIGNAAMQDTEHHEAHLGDSSIESLGKGSSPPGTAKLSDVVTISTMAMIGARPDCAQEIAEKVGEQFGPKNDNQLLRAVKDIGKNPLEPETIGALKSGATYPWKKGGQ